jgi:hypothetical protein
MRIRPYKKKIKGRATYDPFLGFIKGYDRLEAAAYNAMELSIEVESVQHALFPLREVPVADRPGYVTAERNYFGIECDNPVFKEHLEAHFTVDSSRYQGGLYGHGDSIGGYLEMIAGQLLVTGAAYHMIDWGEINIKGTRYQFPVNFDYLPNETMKVIRKDDVIIGYRQKYSLYTYLKEKMFKDSEGESKPRSYEFEKDVIFYLKYPFAEKSPTAQSIKYVPAVNKIWQFGIDQPRSGVEVENYYLPLERARYTTFASEKRKHDLVRAKIRTIFNYLMDTNGPRMTQYYDIFTVIRYKKFLNDFRNYLVNEFNEQVMKPVAIKNGMPCTPKLTVEGFLTNRTLDEALEGYTNGSLSFDQIIETIVKIP